MGRKNPVPRIPGNYTYSIRITPSCTMEASSLHIFLGFCSVTSRVYTVHAHIKYHWSKTETFLWEGKCLENVFHVTYIEMEKRFTLKPTTRTIKYKLILTLKWGRNLTLKKKNLTTYINGVTSPLREVVYQMEGHYVKR